MFNIAIKQMIKKKEKKKNDQLFECNLKMWLSKV